MADKVLKVTTECARGIVEILGPIESLLTIKNYYGHRATMSSEQVPKGNWRILVGNWGRMDVEFDDIPASYSVCGDESYVLVSSDDSYSSSLAVIRLARHILRLSCRASCIHLHAAFGGVGSSVFAVSGEKKSGKTSLLTRLLYSHRCKFLSNDDGFIRDSCDGQMLASSLPRSIRVRRDSLSDCCDVSSALGSGIFQEVDKGEVWKFQIDEYCKALNCERIDSGIITAIAFPRVDPNAAEVKIRKLDETEIFLKLCSNSYPATQLTDSKYISHLERYFDEPKASFLKERLANLARRVSGISITHRNGLYQSSAQIMYDWLCTL